MKLSLAWLSQYLGCPSEQLDGAVIRELLNKTTCEIDALIPVSIESDRFTIARVVGYDDQVATLFCVERQQAFTLPYRSDLVIGWHYFIYNEAGVVTWATMLHAGGEKEGLLGPCHITDATVSTWRQTVVWNDVLLVVDNKSITHRADLWCHYGMAREIAALLHVPLQPIAYIDLPFVEGVPDQYPLNMVVATSHCRKISMAVLADVAILPSAPHVVMQLARLDMKSYNAIVDATNWVMLDVGQPMHAFDLHAFDATRTLTIRQAVENESLVLLDGALVALTSADMVVADGNNVLSLAGIRGGKNSGISRETTSIALEAACLDAGTIRKTVQRIKLRTESSVRFEKTLDPAMTELALRRFIAVLRSWGYSCQLPAQGISLGEKASTPTIVLPLKQLHAALGAQVPSDFVMRSLESIGFQVQFDGKSFSVVVPTWRSQRDITIIPDLIEEIGRLWGYDNIVPQLPSRQMRPFAIQRLERLQMLKKLGAYGLQMHEVQNYPVYDETWLGQLGWQPPHALRLKNPLSTHQQILATSLVPHLLKNVANNMHASSSLRFIEINVIWPRTADGWHEEEKLAFICWDKQQKLNFYEGKQLLATLFSSLHIEPTYHPVVEESLQHIAPWYAPYQSALITVGQVALGYCGMVDSQLLHRVVPFGNAFVTELSVTQLLAVPCDYYYTTPSKYPATYCDLSMQVPHALMMTQLETLIKNISSIIRRVQIIDMFEQSTWQEHKGLTLRVWMQKEDNTLTKQEIDEIWRQVIAAVQGVGCIIR